MDINNQFDNEDLFFVDPLKKYYLSVYYKDTGISLLHKLCMLARKHFPIIKIYLETYKREVNRKTKNGWTPLHVACRNSGTTSSIEMVKLLIENGAIVNETCTEGWTALHLAARHSSRGSNPETVKLLIEKGANIESRMDEGYSPLLLSVTECANGSSIETVKLLLESGAKIDVRDSQGFNALLKNLAII